MANRSTPLLASLLAAAAISACAPTDGDDYPSLAIRPAERVEPEAPAEPPPPPAPLPAEIVARLAELQAAADQASAAFDRLAPGVTTRVQSGRGAAVGSDRWSDAQVAVSQLDAARTALSSALTDIDILYNERAAALESRGEIDIARQGVADRLAAQDATLARLKALLRQ